MLPNFAWVKWFNLAPVLYNSQEKVGLPCLILSMGAGLIGEFFKCNGVNALMWLHLRGHQGPLGDPIYSLHMSKMHGPFGVNLPDEGNIEGCKLIWRWHTVDMMRPRGRYKVEVMGVISPLTLQGDKEFSAEAGSHPAVPSTQERQQCSSPEVAAWGQVSSSARRVLHSQTMPTAGAERKMGLCHCGFVGRISPMDLACVDA
jgi:hypothetical protein